MGLKADSSFLRFVTMGAVGTLATIEQLREAGFEPIELERYSTSNKIWQTKVKRLRLPDVLCARTGIRFEARGKSKLAVKMSHSPNNSDRAWDVGLRDRDIVAFLPVTEPEEDTFEAPHPATCFEVGDLRETFDKAKLGPMKSASEGAEQDVEWPSTVPKKDGRVTAIEGGRLSIYKNGEARPNYTYVLKKKHPYVQVGEQFTAHASMLAGVVPAKADLESRLADTWSPTQDLLSDNAFDRYAAVKAIPVRPDEHEAALPILCDMLNDEPDARVKVEVAATLAKLGHQEGVAQLRTELFTPSEPHLRMEAALILTEVGTEECADVLYEIACDGMFHEDEVRQAAVWGLGAAGCRDYSRLVSFISDEEEEVALHAVCAFGDDIPEEVVDQLVELLQGTDERSQASASYVLSKIGGEKVIRSLIPLTEEDGVACVWAMATLGRLPENDVADVPEAEHLIPQLAPLFLLNERNWLSAGSRPEALGFLEAQVIGD